MKRAYETREFTREYYEFLLQKNLYLCENFVILSNFIHTGQNYGKFSFDHLGNNNFNKKKFKCKQIVFGYIFLTHFNELNFFILFSSHKVRA